MHFFGWNSVCRAGQASNITPGRREWRTTRPFFYLGQQSGRILAQKLRDLLGTGVHVPYGLLEEMVDRQPDLKSKTRKRLKSLAMNFLLCENGGRQVKCLHRTASEHRSGPLLPEPAKAVGTDGPQSRSGARRRAPPGSVPCDDCGKYLGIRPFFLSDGSGRAFCIPRGLSRSPLQHGAPAFGPRKKRERLCAGCDGL